MDSRHLGSYLLLASLFFSFAGVFSPAAAQDQEVRVDVGSGWAIPISSVDMGFRAETEEEGWISLGPRSVDPGADTHFYGAIGFMRSISDNFGLGVRGRAQVAQAPVRGSELFSILPPCSQEGDCTISNRPDGQLRVATLEGRLYLTTIDWIEPYFLVGLGVVQTRLDGVRVEASTGGQIAVGEERFQGTGRFEFEEVRVMDAGGDVGFGASVPVVAGLSLESEIRVTGSLPGGRDSSLSVLPFTVGLSYGFGY